MAIESIGRTFVTVCAFLGVLTILVTGAFSIVGTSELGVNGLSTFDNEQIASTYSTSQINSILKTYDFLTPAVVSVSSMDCGSYWAIDRGLGLIFTDADYVNFDPITNNDKIFVYLTQETVLDGFHHVSHPVYLYFHQAWGGFFGVGASWADAKLDVDKVLNNYNSTDGISYNDIQLKEGYTVLIRPDAGTGIESDWNTHSRFNITMAQTIVNATAVTSGDALQIIGQIMTFSVPNTSPLVNMILAAVLIPTYILMLFFVIRSLIPTLG